MNVPPRCQREPLLEAILDDICEGILVIDADYRIRLANRRAEEVLGRTSSDVLGQRCEAILGSSLCHEGCPVETTRRSGQPVSERMAWFKAGDSEPRPVSVSARPLKDDKGEGLGCLLTITEIAADGVLGREYAGIIGQSPAMKKVFERVRLLADSEASVMITGESGTGKELVARALHNTGPRRTGPFVPVNCAALPSDVLESELFGHIRGSFTGATRDREGRVARAQHGTLFLDEVGDLPLGLQPKLLRLLQEREYEAVGDDRPRRADIRIIAATHVNLARSVEEGRFREDLYYRLNVIPLRLPPLRERQGDVGLLAGHLLQRRRQGTRRGDLVFSKGAIHALEAYSWPGNVRELVNAVDYVIALAAGPVVESSDLPTEITAAQSRTPDAPALTRPTGARRYMPRPLVDEAQEILAALDAHAWHRQSTAAALGMDRVTLYRRMQRLGITRAPRSPG